MMPNEPELIRLSALAVVAAICVGISVVAALDENRSWQSRRTLVTIEIFILVITLIIIFFTF